MRRNTTWAILLTLSFVATASASTKIGVVDVQQVLDAISDGKKAKSEMEKAALSRKGKFETMQKDVQKLKDDLEKHKLVLSPSALKTKEQEFARKATELQQFAVNAQMEMEKKKFELTDSIIGKIRTVIEKIGSGGKYTMVMEKNQGGVFFHQKSLDLTGEVIKAYNKAHGKK